MEFIKAGLLFLIFARCKALLIGREQTVGVRGQLLCGDKPLSNTQVKLWDNDSGPDTDDLMDEGYTDNEGKFVLKGSATEITTIDPVLKVYHDCDDGVKPCQRKVAFIIPDKFVNQGTHVKEYFDIGSINMQIIFEKEERDCIHRK